MAKGDNLGGIPFTVFEQISNIALPSSRNNNGLTAEHAYELMQIAARAQSSALFPGNGSLGLGDFAKAFQEIQAAIVGFLSEPVGIAKMAQFDLLKEAIRKYGKLYVDNGPLQAPFGSVRHLP